MDMDSSAFIKYTTTQLHDNTSRYDRAKLLSWLSIQSMLLQRLGFNHTSRQDFQASLIYRSRIENEDVLDLLRS